MESEPLTVKLDDLMIYQEPRSGPGGSVISGGAIRKPTLADLIGILLSEGGEVFDLRYLEEASRLARWADRSRDRILVIPLDSKESGPRQSPSALLRAVGMSDPLDSKE